MMYLLKGSLIAAFLAAGVAATKRRRMPERWGASGMPYYPDRFPEGETVNAPASKMDTSQWMTHPDSVMGGNVPLLTVTGPAQDSAVPDELSFKPEDLKVRPSASLLDVLHSKCLSFIPDDWKWRILSFGMGPEGAMKMLRSKIRGPKWRNPDGEFQIPHELLPLHALCKKVGKSTGKLFNEFPELADTLADVLPKYGKFFFHTVQQNNPEQLRDIVVHFRDLYPVIGKLLEFLVCVVPSKYAKMMTKFLELKATSECPDILKKYVEMVQRAWGKTVEMSDLNKELMLESVAFVVRKIKVESKDLGLMDKVYAAVLGYLEGILEETQDSLAITRWILDCIITSKQAQATALAESGMLQVQFTSSLMNGYMAILNDLRDSDSLVKEAAQTSLMPSDIFEKMSSSGMAVPLIQPCTSDANKADSSILDADFQAYMAGPAAGLARASPQA